MNDVKEKKKIGLTTQIFIALILGAILGIILNMFAADVDFVQNVFVNGIFYVVGQDDPKAKSCRQQATIYAVAAAVCLVVNIVIGALNK